MSSAATGRLSKVRLSGTPFFFSTVRARVGVTGRGGKTHRWGRNFLFNVLAQGGLVVFDGEQIVGSVFQDQVAGGLVLSMEGVQSDVAPG